MQRIIFVNLHGNEFLVKTLNKIIFRQSIAVKHAYLLEYLLNRDDIEVCTFINRRGLSLSYTTQNRFLQSFRFLEHRYAMKKNGIDPRKITVLRKEEEIRPDDILITYAYYGPTQFVWHQIPDCTRVVCQIHFGTHHSELQRKFAPHAMYNESDLQKYSGMWKRDIPWFSNKFITLPFIPAPRFKTTKDFENRKNKAVSVGTITYMPHIIAFYGESCAQPARRNCRELAKERPDLIDSFNFDYAENQQGMPPKTSKNPIIKTYQRLHAKFTGGHQKQYYSFDMVEKLNSYKIAVVGEEVMGIPGIGFVEAMACGCAYIGQNIGYYEDYGMIEGVHYIGYDGTKEDLANKIEHWLSPQNSKKLEEIASAGQKFVTKNFTKEKIASLLVNELIGLNNRRNRN